MALSTHFRIAICMSTPGRRQSKTLKLSTNVDQKSLETVFSIAICRPTGDKWQSKTLFLAIFDPRLSIDKSVFDCRLPGVMSRLLPSSAHVRPARGDMPYNVGDPRVGDYHHTNWYN